MSRKKILIVDDDERFLRVLWSALQLCCPDCQVESASNGRAALALLRQVDAAESFDMILTDYHMPKMTGLELARLVRETWAKIRIVLMSSDGAALEAATNSLSFDGYLVKPFALKELAKVLQLNQ